MPDTYLPGIFRALAEGNSGPVAILTGRLFTTREFHFARIIEAGRERKTGQMRAEDIQFAGLTIVEVMAGAGRKCQMGDSRTAQAGIKI